MRAGRAGQMRAVPPTGFAMMAALASAVVLPHAQAVSVLSRNERGATRAAGGFRGAGAQAGPIEVAEAPGVLLALREIADHAAIFSAAAEANPRVSSCASHLGSLIRRLDRHYTDAQLRTVLVNFCITSEEYSSLPGFQDGFRSQKACETFAKNLVEARDAELAGEEGAESGYTGLCRSYLGIKRRVKLPAPKKKKVHTKERAYEVAEERSQPREEPKMTAQVGSRWWLLGWIVLSVLNCSGLLICCFGAFRTPQQPPAPPKMSSIDMLRAIDRGQRGAWADMAETFFDTFDIDRSGVLEKTECKKAVEQVSRYIAEKYREHKGSSVTPAMIGEIQNRIRREVDANNDGKISKEEFMQNIKRIVDDLD